MVNFCRNAGRGYMMVVEPVNDIWLYLFSFKWLKSSSDALCALFLFAVLVPITPFAYLCVAPFVAFLEGTREGEEE